MLKVANAPCSWGVIENIEGERTTYEKVINEMQEAGFVGTELGDWGFMPTDPDHLRNELAQRRLELMAGWVSTFLHDANRHDESVEAAVKHAELLAAVGGQSAFVNLGNDPYADPMRSKYCGRIQPEHGMSDEQWRLFVDGAHRVAEAVKRETGLRTLLHHHTGTWVETPEETTRFLEMSDPELIGLCFDTGHYMFGGGDPIEGLRRHADRIWHVHFKDCDQAIAAQSRVEEWDGPTSVGKGVFCELGTGSVDFQAVTNVLEEIGYDGWIVVEQDVLPGMGTPRESAIRNREYLRSIGL